jgi:hypothetical protein
MSDQREDLTDEATSLAVISHRGILYKMAAVVAFGATLGFAFFSPKAGFGVLAGGALAFANYFWQRHSIKVIFDRAVDGKRTRFLALRYILRYVVLGAALMAIYLSETVSIIAVILGLSSFAIAVLVEGLVSLVSGSSKQES